MADLATPQSAATARVIDLETTGTPEEDDARICEVGFVDVDLTAPDFPVLPETRWTSLVDPGCAMRPEVIAIHHITDADLVDAQPPEVAFRALAAGMTDADVYVAHNAKFEQHFYSSRPQRWVCTYKCALRAWPEAPGHSNQVLRYWLKLDVDRQLAQPPHRALPDAYVTAHILQALLKMRPIERLIEVSSEPGFLPKLTFGKHRGTKFADAPTDYLEWLVAQKDMDADVKFTARWHLERRAT